MWPLSAECEVLLCAAHPAPDTAALARIDALTGRPFDWERCRALATHHGMTPLLVRALSECSTRAWPPEIWNRAIEETRAIAIDNLSASAELLRIIEDLDAAGIAALAVKGPAAGIAVYGDAALRPFLDLDVLVAPQDRNRAIERLIARGYQPEPDLDAASRRRYFQRYLEMICIHPQTGVAVDLHWALLDPRYRYSAVLAGCHERASSLSIGARRIRTLSREDMLLYCLLHAAKHQWSVLRMLVDAALLIETHEGLDWGAISGAVARAPSCRRMIAVGLRLVELLFDVPTNDLAALWIASDARAGALANEAFRFLTGPEAPAPPGPPWPWRQRFYQSMCRQDRLRFTYDTLLAPTTLEWMAVPLPEWLDWVYPAIRIARLSAKHLSRA